MSDLTLVNAIEVVVQDLFKEFEKDYALKCDCEKCKLDILAITLNNIPPRYVASDAGPIYVKSLYFTKQLQLDVYSELTKATLIVEQSPRH
jgi:competence protein ComFB